MADRRPLRTKRVLRLLARGKHARITSAEGVRFFGSTLPLPSDPEAGEGRTDRG